MDWFGQHMVATWLLIAVVLGVLELMSTDLILIMLAGGALSGAVISAVGASAPVQIGVALAVSLGLLGLLRPNLVHRLHAGPTLVTGAKALVGRQGLVLEPMTYTTPGRVKIGGDEWTARPYDEGDRIEAGETVDVVEIKGATAYVLRSGR